MYPIMPRSLTQQTARQTLDLSVSEQPRQSHKSDRDRPHHCAYRSFLPILTVGVIAKSLTMDSQSKSYEYALLPIEEGSERDQPHDTKHHHNSWLHLWALRGAIYVTIGGSLLFNIAQLTLWLSKNEGHALGDRSVTAYGTWLHGPYEASLSNMKAARLSWNSPGAFEHNGIYDNKDPKVTEESWDSLRYDLGSVALADEYIESRGLPRAQRFPWDESKGLYFLNGYHGVHCLVFAPMCPHPRRWLTGCDRKSYGSR
jgi:hypothetical protein